MIEFQDVSFRYDHRGPVVLRNVTLHVPEGELCLVVGATGSGKSTLLGAVNGLVPHFTGGHLSGRVTVDGRDTSTHPPRELADVVGVVGQNPWAGFVTDTVVAELAYTMESLGLPNDVMRRRIEDTLDLLSLTDLRERPLSTLSGGQAQRVSIGAVLTAQPRVLVLDEPTSALDPASAEEVLAVLQRLVHDLGLTVLMAEHRLERVVHYADSIVTVSADSVRLDTPAAAMATSPVVPPVVELGRLASWAPLPLSIRDARRAATELKQQLSLLPAPANPALPEHEPVARVERLTVRYGDLVALREVSLAFGSGTVTAVMGRNGAGKSTLFAALTGMIRPSSGHVRLDRDDDPRRLGPRQLVRRVGLVPQQPGDLLYAETVAAECVTADAETGVRAGTTRALLERIAGPIQDRHHPRDLSEGQRLSLALAVVLTSAPPLLLLDEPTRGLDYPAKARLGLILTDLAAAGHAVVIATHDVELAAEISQRAVVLADGAVVADGSTRAVVTHTPVFAPQVAKVLSPLPYLTVTDVRRALATSP
jgi:energy-coupling factor transporter ATP-binding protein EcfA2